MQQIIGVVGPTCSGKGEVANVLKEKGFFVVSLSDILRSEAKTRGIEITVPNLQDLGDELREKYGSDILSEIALRKIEDLPKVVIESIRHPKEIMFFKSKGGPGMKVIAVMARMEKRFQYMEKRGREGDPKTWEEFRIVSEREFDPDQPHKINIPACIDLSDYVIKNNSNLIDLRYQIQKCLSILGIEGNPKSIERK